MEVVERCESEEVVVEIANDGDCCAGVFCENCVDYGLEAVDGSE